MQDNSYDEEMKYKNKYKKLKRKYFAMFKEYHELNKEFKFLRKRYRVILEENMFMKDKDDIKNNTDKDKDS